MADLGLRKSVHIALGWQERDRHSQKQHLFTAESLAMLPAVEADDGEALKALKQFLAKRDWTATLDINVNERNGCIITDKSRVVADVLHKETLALAICRAIVQASQRETK